MPEQKTTPKKIDAAERRSRIMKLRLHGYTYEEIGKTVGCVKSYAYKIVKEELQKLIDKASLNAKQLQKMECEKLDLMETKLSASIQAGHHGAIKTWLSICDRRAKLLGLDSPTKIDHSGEVEIVVTPAPRPEQDA